MTNLEKLAVSHAIRIHTSFTPQLPVNLDSLCATLDIIVKHYECEPWLDGLYRRTASSIHYILVNSNAMKPEGRRRFTQAHEMAHFLIAGDVEFTEECHMDCTHRVWTPLERACNTFAAKLLMPDERIRQWYEDLKHNKEYRDVIIAERCGVTVSAVKVKCERLGLIRHFGAGEYYR